MRTTASPFGEWTDPPRPPRRRWPSPLGWLAAAAAVALIGRIVVLAARAAAGWPR